MRKRRRRCPYCGELFWPDGRTAWRQWACGKAECQGKRRRDTQHRYRERNIGDREARRYRSSIAEVKESPEGEIRLPRGGIYRSCLWSEIKDEIAPELYVTLLFFAQLLTGAKKDERMIQPFVSAEEIAKLAKAGPEDEMERIEGAG